MSALGDILAFLAAHTDLIEALYKAITSGASKDSLKKAIEEAEIEASDAVAREELGLPQK